jgi:1-acyl-sn-glycerol-3-phosphate acyltransferase
MVRKSLRKSVLIQCGDCLSDFVVTMICWTYFTLGFVVFFSVRYLAAYLFSPQRALAFQRLTSSFYRGFFRLVRFIAPRHKWKIDEQITDLTSSVIICNHLSYLDPILLISLLKHQKTIVKTKFFKVPIFGWLIRNAGYFPADGEGKFARMMIEQVEQMDSYLAGGGNLFVFPEGTRSRDDEIGSLSQGALKIARLCQVPIFVLRLAGTENLFAPGKFFFNTQVDNIVTLTIVDCIEPDSRSRQSLGKLENRIRQAFIMKTDSGACTT